MAERVPGYSKNGYLVTSKTNNGELEKKVFVWPCSDAAQIDRKLTQKIVLELHRAVAYRHSTVYCTVFTVMPKYSRMPSVAIGCGKNLVAFCRKSYTCKFVTC